MFLEMLLGFWFIVTFYWVVAKTSTIERLKSWVVWLWDIIGSALAIAVLVL